ncbi:hypothetical protein LEP1GSC127_4122 [Leptospira kirschneri str. 200801925]|nr:hypothetical protein LEP1GSC127_4122 [Leptospira kirschneri str. 200801925]
MDLNINLSELRQILCKKSGPTVHVLGGGREVVGKFERFSLSEKHTFCK